MPMNDLWTWLEMLPLAARIGESWWFPLLESIHVLSTMWVVGSILFVDLRLLGAMALRYPYARFSEEILNWTWVGFAAAVVTGFGMFMTRASAYAANRAFQLKVALLMLAAINLIVFRYVGMRNIARWDTTVSAVSRLAGATSLVIWIGVTLAGRWTGHLY